MERGVVDYADRMEQVIDLCEEAFHEKVRLLADAPEAAELTEGIRGRLAEAPASLVLGAFAQLDLGAGRGRLVEGLGRLLADKVTAPPDLLMREAMEMLARVKVAVRCFGACRLPHHGAAFLRALELAWPDVNWRRFYEEVCESSAAAEWAPLDPSALQDEARCSAMSLRDRLSCSIAVLLNEAHNRKDMQPGSVCCRSYTHYSSDEAANKGGMDGQESFYVLGQIQFKNPNALRQFSDVFNGRDRSSELFKAMRGDGMHPATSVEKHVVDVVGVPSPMASMAPLVSSMLWEDFIKTTDLLFKTRPCSVTFTPIPHGRVCIGAVRPEFNLLAATALDGEVLRACEEARSTFLKEDGRTVDPARYIRGIMKAGRDRYLNSAIAESLKRIIILTKMFSPKTRRVGDDAEMGEDAPADGPEDGLEYAPDSRDDGNPVQTRTVSLFGRRWVLGADGDGLVHVLDPVATVEAHVAFMLEHRITLLSEEEGRAIVDHVRAHLAVRNKRKRASREEDDELEEEDDGDEGTAMRRVRRRRASGR